MIGKESVKDIQTMLVSVSAVEQGLKESLTKIAGVAI